MPRSHTRAPPSGRLAEKTQEAAQLEEQLAGIKADLADLTSLYNAEVRESEALGAKLRSEENAAHKLANQLSDLAVLEKETTGRVDSLAAALRLLGERLERKQAEASEMRKQLHESESKTEMQSNLMQEEEMSKVGPLSGAARHLSYRMCAAARACTCSIHEPAHARAGAHALRPWPSPVPATLRRG